jgi:integrase
VAYNDAPDFVSGRKGRFELAPQIEHPPFCVCKRCPLYRQREAEKTGDPIESIWARSITYRFRKVSPHPSDRKASALAALRLKTDEEKRLREATAQADAERRARQLAVSFGAAVDAYRDYQIREGKEIDRSKSLIENIEAFIGRGRDVEAVDYKVYQAVLGEVENLHPETRRHYASMLLAILNNAKAVRLIASHQLEGVRVPQVLREDEPEPWTRQELAVLMGPALRRYEKEQREWNAKVATEKKNRGKRSPSFIPLRGLCLVGYYTLMRPDNNRSLDWEEITLDAATMRGSFKLDQHKNVNKGIKARGPIARELVEYLLSIRPPNASGPIHANPETGRPYVDIRKQWKRLLAITAEMLGYELTGKKAKFLNFRHTGASHIAQRGRDPRHLLAVVKMMGDTSVATVNRHYFNLEDDLMQEIIDGWAVPDVEVFAADLEPVCADPAAGDDDAPAVAIQPLPRRAHK